MIVLLMALPLAFAEKAEGLTLKEAIALAKLKKGNDEIYAINLRLAKKELADAKKYADKRVKNVVDADSQASYNIETYYTVKVKEKAVAKMIEQKKQEDQQLAIDVAKAYFALGQSYDRLEVQRVKLIEAKKDYEASALKFKDGRISKLAYDQASLAFKQEEQAEERGRVNYLKERMAFNQQIGVALATETLVTERFWTDYQKGKQDLLVLKDDMVNEHKSVKDLKEELAMAEWKMTLIYPEKTEYGYPNAYYPLLKEIERLKAQMVRTQENVRLKLKTDIYGIMDKDSDMKLALMRIKIEEEKLAAYQLEFEAGIRDEASYKAQKKKLTSERKDYKVAEYERALMYLDVEIYLGRSNALLERIK